MGANVACIRTLPLVPTCPCSGGSLSSGAHGRTCEDADNSCAVDSYPLPIDIYANEEMPSGGKAPDGDGISQGKDWPSIGVKRLMRSGDRTEWVYSNLTLLDVPRNATAAPLCTFISGWDEGVSDEWIQSQLNSLEELKEEQNTDAWTSSCGSMAKVRSDAENHNNGEATRSETLVPLPPKLFSPEETLIIFDWDDTILPTTWVSIEGLFKTGSVQSDHQKEQLDEVACSALSMVSIAKQYGTVVVITNSDQGWIELSTLRYIPSLFWQVSNTKCLSARTSYEKAGACETPSEWKKKAFNEVIETFFEGSDGRRQNVISLGDSMEERNALLCNTDEAENCYPKSIKLLEKPGIEHILAQHEMITNCLERIVQCNSNLDLYVASSPASQAAASSILWQ